MPCTELALTYGTPLLTIDYDELDRAIAAFTSAAQPHGIEIAYAGKALLLTKLAEHFKHTPLSLDVCSLGELLTAERAEFPPERITMHGCAKTDAELDALREGRAGRIVVDNLDELRRLAAITTPSPLTVLLRINTGIEAHTHEYVHTSGQGSKFGFDDASLPPALDLINSAAHLRFDGLHSHIGSQIYEERSFAANASALMDTAAFCARAGLKTRTVIVGGGFGIPMHPESGDDIDLAATMSAIASMVQTQASLRNIALPRIGIEPGRAIVGAAGVSIYTVVAAKRQFGKAYAIVDGGMYENPRPALYDAYHHTVCGSRADAELVETAVCGRSCENDYLVTALLPADLRTGDIVAMFATGAYTYSMASNYNRFPRPAVVAVRGGEHSLLARREDDAATLQNDA